MVKSWPEYCTNCWSSDILTTSQKYFVEVRGQRSQDTGNPRFSVFTPNLASNSRSFVVIITSTFTLVSVRAPRTDSETQWNSCSSSSSFACLLRLNKMTFHQDIKASRCFNCILAVITPTCFYFCQTRMYLFASMRAESPHCHHRADVFYYRKRNLLPSPPPPPHVPTPSIPPKTARLSAIQ